MRKLVTKNKIVYSIIAIIMLIGAIAYPMSLIVIDNNLVASAEVINISLNTKTSVTVNAFGKLFSCYIPDTKDYVVETRGACSTAITI